MGSFFRTWIELYKKEKYGGIILTTSDKKRGIIMKRILVLVLIIVVLSGCHSKELMSNELHVDQIEERGKLDPAVQEFIQFNEDTNGTHLYFYNKEIIYIFLNEVNVLNGEKPYEITNFNVEGVKDILNIFVETKQSNKGYSESIPNSLIYEITLDHAYDSIDVVKNGKETSLTSVSGSGN